MAWNAAAPGKRRRRAQGGLRSADPPGEPSAPARIRLGRAGRQRPGAAEENLGVTLPWRGVRGIFASVRPVSRIAGKCPAGQRRARRQVRRRRLAQAQAWRARDRLGCRRFRTRGARLARALPHGQLMLPASRTPAATPSLPAVPLPPPSRPLKPGTAGAGTRHGPGPEAVRACLPRVRDPREAGRAASDVPCLRPSGGGEAGPDGRRKPGL